MLANSTVECVSYQVKEEEKKKKKKLAEISFLIED